MRNARGFLEAVVLVVVLALGVLPAKALVLDCHWVDIQQSTYRIYVSATGSDSANGCTKSTAIRSLDHANDVLNANAPIATVRVEIDPTTEFAGASDRVVWTFFNEGFPTYILPYDKDPTALITGRVNFTRPVFRNTSTSTVSCCYFFNFKPTLSTAKIYSTGIHVLGLQIREFAHGAAEFQSDNTSAKVANNFFSNNDVIKLGDVWDPPTQSLGNAGVALIRTNLTTISYNKFSFLENAGDNGDLIHAAYIQHDSDSNLFTQNRVATHSGDPIRVRDGSDNNTASYNTITNAGWDAVMSEWRDDRASANESASYGNKLYFNDTEKPSGYNGRAIEYTCWMKYTTYPTCGRDPKRIATNGNDGPSAGNNW